MNDSDPRPRLPETLEWHVLPEPRRRLTRRGLLVGTLGFAATGGVVWAARLVLAPASPAALLSPTATAAPRAAAAPVATALPVAPTSVPTLAATSVLAAPIAAVPPTAIPTATMAAALARTSLPASGPVVAATSTVGTAAETALPVATEGVPVAQPPATFAPAPAATVAPAVVGGSAEQMVIGHSVEGRDIVAYKLGNGPVGVALIGDIHGAWEPRAQQVAQVGLDYFRASRSAVPDGATVYVILTANPDGWANGQPFLAKADGTGGPGDVALSEFAFNANGMDLNRNFPTNWSDRPCGGERFRLHYGNMCMQGKAGPEPFSEPETRAYRDFILSRKIKMALTYHENRYPSISIREGGKGRSEPFAKTLAAHFGYDYLPVWPDYPVTGQAQDWLDANNVLGAEIELRHHTLEPRLDTALNIKAMQMAIDAALLAAR
ncbi:MAG TPA: M14 family metallopeptidase [Chloroflexota bacterium]|nr:M14 family metallopeptidase [Chloroflexota bacterium]